MNAVVCTLFEGHYHFGVAALTNSLYKQGFRGEIFAGYRGSLPEWAKNVEDNNLLSFTGAKTLRVGEGLSLHFVPLVTDYHLTNYKPDFMLQIWEVEVEDADSCCYFDPDIVLTAPWSYLEEWISCGIGLCEDVKSPLEKYHPRRMGWRRYYKKYNTELNFKNSIYVNGGFVGINRSNKAFLKKWQLLQQYMGDSIGGLSKSSISDHSRLPEEMSYEYFAFGATDQDALNATIEASDLNISYMGKEAMALEAGGQVLMPHAIGTPKPWVSRPFTNFIKGKVPRLVDKEYWKSVEYPIQSYSKLKIRKMNLLIKIFSFLSRFYNLSH